MEINEYGSDFHYVEGDLGNVSHISGDISNVSDIKFHFSGRAALFNILLNGIKRYNWTRVGFPSYYCHEVVEFCSKLPIELIYYTYSPFNDNSVLDWLDVCGSVFVNVDFFGVTKLDTSFLEHSIVIEDLTHNILSLSASKADYCFASLRKQLPVGGGGIAVGLNYKLDYFVETSEYSERVALKRLVGMFLKSEYLSGAQIDKGIYRNLFIESENFFKSEQSNTGIPTLFKNLYLSLNQRSLIDTTYNNVNFAKKILRIKRDRIFNIDSSRSLGLIILFESNNFREDFRSFLISRNVYPAILWPNQKLEDDIDFSNRMLFIHLDFRYDREDITSIVSIINEFYDKCI